MIRFFAFILRPFFWVLDMLTPLAYLLARLWVSWVFFKAGVTKIQSWDSTIALFTNEYSVPFLLPTTAAVLGTGAELILPILLAIGFGSRLMIAIFFFYNVVAVVSYEFLWTPDGWHGLTQHISWGLLLGLLMTHGPGKLSVDYWIRKSYGKHLERRPR